ncbi:hypothetical protein [Niallia endozanthoxylica]|uniref:hypothetical protein n=1 Tax=Niallia endozanthoxylica TaxID=2036016 RepID=UPI0037C8A696
MMINEFIQLFEIEESELTETQNKSKENLGDAAFTGKDTLHDNEKGIKRDETN